jgi:hypothetical protein
VAVLERRAEIQDARQDFSEREHYQSDIAAVANKTVPSCAGSWLNLLALRRQRRVCAGGQKPVHRCS